MQQLQVDILLATYNGARFLPELLDSLRAQTHAGWRLLASDDGSFDETPAILGRYASQDSRIEIVSAGRRIGGARDNFFYLLRRSTAPYFAFCDQDDVWLPDKLAAQLTELKRIESGGKTDGVGPRVEALACGEETASSPSRVAAARCASSSQIRTSSDDSRPQVGTMIGTSSAQTFASPAVDPLRAGTARAAQAASANAAEARAATLTPSTGTDRGQAGCPSPGLVFSDLYVVAEDLSPIAKSFFEYENDDPARTSFGNLLAQNVSPGCVMLGNAALREAVRIPEDTGRIIMHDWWVMLAAAAFGQIAFLPQATVLYRQHGGNAIGAKSFSVAEKATHMQRARASIMAAQRQAGTWAECYRGVAAEELISMCEGYADLAALPRAQRLAALGRFGLWKPGIPRKVGQALVVLGQRRHAPLEVQAQGGSRQPNCRGRGPMSVIVQVAGDSEASPATEGAHTPRQSHVSQNCAPQGPKAFFPEIGAEPLSENPSLSGYNPERTTDGQDAVSTGRSPGHKGEDLGIAHRADTASPRIAPGSDGEALDVGREVDAVVEDLLNPCRPARVFAGIITFNPDLSLLRQCLCAIAGQVDRVVVVDNGSDSIDQVESLIRSLEGTDFPRRVSLQRNDANLGVAAALNQLCAAAATGGATWLVTFDQDSVAPADMVGAYLAHLDAHQVPDAGMLCARLQDRNLGELTPYDASMQVQEVRECITSGSMMSLPVWYRLGGFDERFFIDEVDHEYSHRMAAHGWKTYQANDVVLSHELGCGFEVHTLLGAVRLDGHSAFRRYYIVRNTAWLARREGRSVVRALWPHVKSAAKVLFFEDDKHAKLASMARGLRDGLRMRK